jgi:hypothetical protein
MFNLHRTPSLNTDEHQFSTINTNNKVQFTYSHKCNFNVLCKLPEFYNTPHIQLRILTPYNCADQKVPPALSFCLSLKSLF